MKTETLAQIQSLNRNASALAGIHAKVDHLRKDSRNDKLGCGFGVDNRFAAFSVAVSFDSYVGTYGNSSCARILGVDEALVKPFITKALNVHQRAILATAAELMRTEAATMTAKAREEIAALQKMVDELSTAQNAEAA